MKIDLEKVRISFQKFVIENRLPSCVIVVADEQYKIASLPGSFGTKEGKRFSLFLQHIIDVGISMPVEAQTFAERALASLNKG